ncbi:AAA family ATPase [Russula brevipes]|nr:AAA family ATPase [Russula brevipes]
MADRSPCTFTVRAADHDDARGRAIRRIFLGSDAMKSAKWFSGDVVALAAAPENCQQQRPFAVGTVWPSLELANDVVELAATLLLTADISEGSKVVIHPLSSPSTVQRPTWLPSLQAARHADIVRLCEVDINGATIITLKASEKVKQRDWLTLFITSGIWRSSILSWCWTVDLKYVLSTQVLPIQYESTRHFFSVSTVSTRMQNVKSPESNILEGLGALSVNDTQLYIVDWDTTVVIDDNLQASESKQPSVKISHSSSICLCGRRWLDEQIAQIRDLIEIPLRRPEIFRHFRLKPPRGVLLHGPPGTGKTHLARAISASTGSSVLTVNGPELTSAYHGETEASLRRVFATARTRAPCIIILDEVDAICPRRVDDAGGEVEKRVVATLLTEMDGVDNTDARVVVIATTNRPNAIDPALRRPGRFDREIEIGAFLCSAVPDLNARTSILDVLLAKTPHAITPDELHATASRAHGYVGADLAAVVREAGTLAIKRFLASAPAQSVESAHLTAADLAAALPTVRPSTLRAHAIATPPVRFADIGGLESTIARLRECVEWPLVHREKLTRLGARAPKGVLLCGPPGCSKTVLVRAIAAESGVNFVAVRGPELLNKYVGESERAVREIFRRARSASPSIIFFDEIDALASSRSPGSVDGGTHEGVLLSMLNEMDGVEELVGVTVIGATNRPEALDPALMRPGRLDRILYVGPPDFVGRVDIFRIRTRNMAVEPALDLDALAALTSGCSGAEITAICQEAALIAMREDINASLVPQAAFVTAAKALKRQITPEILQKFERWRDAHTA